MRGDREDGARDGVESRGKEAKATELWNEVVPFSGIVDKMVWRMA